MKSIIHLILVLLAFTSCRTITQTHDSKISEVTVITIEHRDSLVPVSSDSATHYTGLIVHPDGAVTIPAGYKNDVDGHLLENDTQKGDTKANVKTKRDAYKLPVKGLNTTTTRTRTITIANTITRTVHEKYVPWYIKVLMTITSFCTLFAAAQWFLPIPKLR